MWDRLCFAWKVKNLCVTEQLDLVSPHKQRSESLFTWKVDETFFTIMAEMYPLILERINTRSVPKVSELSSYGRY